METSDRRNGLNTRLLHTGKIEENAFDSVVTPIFQSATFYATDYKDVRYPRFNNTPNQLVLHARLADAEEAEASLVTASGMAAIATGVLTCVQSGDHLIAQRCLYGNTFTLFDTLLPRFGIEVDFFDTGDASESIAPLIKPNTKAVYVESLSNPVVSVTDLQGVVDVCKSHGLLSLVDNTFATPVLFKPIPFGFDFSIHSATKYLNGHSDLTAGVVSCRSELMETANLLSKTLGGNIDPHAAFLFERGLKTLVLRVTEQNRTASESPSSSSREPKSGRSTTQVSSLTGITRRPSRILAVQRAGYSASSSEAEQLRPGSSSKLFRWCLLRRASAASSRS